MSNLNLVNFDRSHPGDNNDNIDSALQQALSNFEDAHDPQLRAHHQHHDHQDKNNVPIDPSIGSASEKEAVAAVAAAAANAANFARSTAQAAVNSSKTRVPRQQHTGPKVTKPRVNKPGQKFGAKKKSWVWNWFLQDTEDCNLATCDYCGKVIKRLDSDKGSPKKLGEHLKTHKIDRTSVNQRRDHIMNPSADGRQFFNTLNTGASNFKPHPLSSESQQTTTAEQHAEAEADAAAAAAAVEALDMTMFDQSAYTQHKLQKEIVKFVAENKLSLSVIKSHSFRQIVYTLKPQALGDLNELNHMYSSIMNGRQPEDKDDNINLDDQHQVVDATSGPDNAVDELNASTSWV